MPTLSVIITTKDHESIIERALRSVKFADEIVIIDLHSQDKTVEIARQYTQKIFTHQNYGYVEPVRNFSISKASGDWILIIDADEEIPAGLRKALNSIVSAENQTELPDCFYLPRKNIIFNQWIQKTGWWPDFQLRFFKAGHVEWLDQIHSVPITRGEVKEFPAREKFAIVHHNYQTIDRFIIRLNHYSSIQAQEKTAVEQLVQPSTVFKTFAQELFQRLFAQQGYQEGLHGLSLSLLQSLSEAVVLMKVWEEAGFERSQESPQQFLHAVKQFRRELAFWVAEAQLQEVKGLGRLYWRLRRKLMV